MQKSKAEQKSMGFMLINSEQIEIISSVGTLNSKIWGEVLFHVVPFSRQLQVTPSAESPDDPVSPRIGRDYSFVVKNESLHSFLK